MAKVLLVDDDEDVLDAVAAWLGREHEVATALGAAQALACLANGPVPDVVVTDYDMFPHRGTDLLTLVAELFPDACRILYSGSAPELAAEEAAVVQHLVSKSSHLGVLNALIHRCTRSAAPTV